MVNSFYSFGFILFAYLLGSVPFGFIFSRLSGKNILEIGWKKTSGSNVFKNVGWWQGALTGICDISKGFLVVWLAKEMGFSSSVQVLSGVAAVVGHNWSCFLGFAGGRGIGTLFGAFFCLSPIVFGWSFLFFVLLSLIWDAAIGTIIFLIAAIFVSVYFGQFDTAGIFTLIILFPVFIKRLSPMKEIMRLPNRGKIIKNRLIFDNDEGSGGFRIKKIIGWFF